MRITDAVDTDMEDIEKRDKEIAFLGEQGTLTLEEISKEYGITRERIRQILKREGVTKRSGPHLVDVKLSICPICQRKYISDTANQGQNVIQRGREQGYLTIRDHCRKYRHPRLIADWKKSQSIVQDYQAGMRPLDIIKKHNLKHTETIYRFLEQWYVEPRYERGREHVESRAVQPVGHDIKKQRAVARARKHHTLEYVAKKFNISQTRVRQLAKKYSE